MITHFQITLPGGKVLRKPIGELNDYKTQLSGAWDRIWDSGCRFVVQSVAVDTLYLKAEPC